MKILLALSKTEIVNIEYIRTDVGFRNYLNSKIDLGNHLSFWKVPKEFSSILLNGKAELENKQLWTPEDISISWGNDEIDLGDDVIEIQGVKLYIWGYGYFFPYSIDEVITKLLSSDLINLLHNSLAKIGIETCCDGDVMGEISRLQRFDGFKYPIIIQQSL